MRRDRNSLECPECKKITNHIEISCREASALNDDSELEQLGCAILDGIGLTKGVSAVFGRRYYKCCVCGYTTLRTTSGKIVDIIGFDKWFRKKMNEIEGKKK